MDAPISYNMRAKVARKFTFQWREFEVELWFFDSSATRSEKEISTWVNSMKQHTNATARHLDTAEKEKKY